MQCTCGTKILVSLRWGLVLIWKKNSECSHTCTELTGAWPHSWSMPTPCGTRQRQGQRPTIFREIRTRANLSPWWCSDEQAMVRSPGTRGAWFPWLALRGNTQSRPQPQHKTGKSFWETRKTDVNSLGSEWAFRARHRGRGSSSLGLVSRASIDARERFVLPRVEINKLMPI